MHEPAIPKNTSMRSMLRRYGIDEASFCYIDRRLHVFDDTTQYWPHRTPNSGGLSMLHAGFLQVVHRAQQRTQRKWRSHDARCVKAEPHCLSGSGPRQTDTNQL